MKPPHRALSAARHAAPSDRRATHASCPDAVRGPSFR
jgi:hypothetical protein